MANDSPAKWSHNKVFEDVGVAIENHVTPSEFWGKWNNQDKALAIAHSRATKTMTAWEHHLHDQEIRRQRTNRKQPR